MLEAYTRMHINIKRINKEKTVVLLDFGIQELKQFYVDCELQYVFISNFH